MIRALALMVTLGAAAQVQAEDVGCTSTTFRIFGPNDKVCVQAFACAKVSPTGS